MKFSLLVPTRERPQAVVRLLDSLLFTTGNIKDIEILFAVDEDDAITKEVFTTVLKDYKYNNLKLQVFYRERSEFSNRDYYNWLSDKAIGQFLWAIGDDVVFQVEKWDSIISTKIEEYLIDKPDRVVCVGVKDNTPKPKIDLPQFPCFPVITQEAKKAVGYFLHPYIPNWGADYLLYLLYAGANRYLAIDDNVYLLHIGIHTHTGPKDTTAQNVENTFNRLKMNPDYNIDIAKDNKIPYQVEELKKYITDWRA